MFNLSCSVENNQNLLEHAILLCKNAFKKLDFPPRYMNQRPNPALINSYVICQFRVTEFGGLWGERKETELELNYL